MGKSRILFFLSLEEFRFEEGQGAGESGGEGEEGDSDYIRCWGGAAAEQGIDWWGFFILHSFF